MHDVKSTEVSIRQKLTCLVGALGAVLFAMVAFVPLAHAHVAKLSSSHIELIPDGVSSEIRVNVVDVQFVLKDVIDGSSLIDEIGEVNVEALAKNSDLVSRFILDNVSVLTEELEACTAIPQGAPKAYEEEVDIEQVFLRVKWTCPSGSVGLMYQVTLFQEVDKGARHILLIADGEEQRQALIDIENNKVPLTKGSITLAEVFVDYVYTGIEHIWIGYDHIAFLLAVVLWGRRFWPLFRVVTAFTVAHSITLSLAVFNVIQLPSSFVEAMIAATIVYVALENIFIRDLDRRWRITFLLGLFHGLGFASVLRDFGLPSDALALALVAFNVGVEIGQLVIVAIAVGLLLLLDKTLAEPGVAPMRRPALVFTVSAAIAIMGFYWLGLRTVFA